MNGAKRRAKKEKSMQPQTKDSIGIPAKFDDKTMSAMAIISTPAVDRDWEIMVPRGCKLESFAKGPAPWFFNHQQIPFPIGSSKRDATDPNCIPDVTIEDDLIWAKCYFNQTTPEAPIIYELWKMGHLGATSIGFQGLKSTELSTKEAQEMGAPYNVRRWDEWDLVEISIVGVGANREALAMHASRGHVGKMQLTPILQKAFNSFAMPRKLWPTMVSYPSGKDNPPILLKTPKGSKMAEHEGEVQPKPGHALLQGLAAHCSEMMKSAAEGLPSLELDDVRNDVLKTLKSLHEGMSSMIETHKDKYEGLAMDDLPEGLDFKGIKEDAEGPGDDGPSDDDKPSDPEGTDEEDIPEEEAKQWQAYFKSIGDTIEDQEKQLAALGSK